MGRASRMAKQRARVYRMLRFAGRRGVTAVQFVRAYILRFSARIFELRSLGGPRGGKLKIRSERVPGKTYYRYWIA